MIEIYENNGQWFGNNLDSTAHATQIDRPFVVETKEGVMEGKAGDYLMEGVDGELYVCDEEIFKKTYEFLEDPT